MAEDNLTRRDFLKGALTTATASCLPSCSFLQIRNLPLEQRILPENYAKISGDWDPIYGPGLLTSSRYGGKNDFEGHRRYWGPGAGAVDYFVTLTPVVPAFRGIVNRIDQDRSRTGGLQVFLRRQLNPRHMLGYTHLDSLVVTRAFQWSAKFQDPSRVLARNEIIAISGNSGLVAASEFFGGKQPYHLDFALDYWRNPRDLRSIEDIDPEKYGIDGGRLTFWDGKTDLDVIISERPKRLEEVMQGFGKELEDWQDRELTGTLIEYRKLMDDAKGTRILDSKHFHDLRALLKKVSLEKKQYTPGSESYSMMLKVLGYITEQPVILTLPFISPALLDKGIYKKPVYEDGPFEKFLNV